MRLWPKGRWNKKYRIISLVKCVLNTAQIFDEKQAILDNYTEQQIADLRNSKENVFLRTQTMIFVLFTFFFHSACLQILSESL